MSQARRNNDVGITKTGQKMYAQPRPSPSVWTFFLPLTRASHPHCMTVLGMSASESERGGSESEGRRQEEEEEKEKGEKRGGGGDAMGGEDES